MSGDRDDLGGRPGLALWGPVGRWVFLNWPRGSWQYDLICAAIIAALFVLPGPPVDTPATPAPGPHLAQPGTEPAPHPRLAHGEGETVPGLHRVRALRRTGEITLAAAVRGSGPGTSPVSSMPAAFSGISTRRAQRAQLDADGVLSEMERVGRDLESFRAGFTSVKRYALFDDREVESGTLLFLQPSFVKRLVEEPQRRIEVVSSGQAQVYIPRIKQVQLYSFDDGATEQPRFALPGISDPEELREEYEVVLEGVDEDVDIGAVPGGGDGDPARAAGSDRGAAGDGSAGGGSRTGVDSVDRKARYYVLELTPLPGSEAAGRLRRLRLWVPEGTWLPAHRIELVEHTGDTTRIDLYDIVRNPDLSRSDFELDLPSDVEVVRHE